MIWHAIPPCWQSYNRACKTLMSPVTTTVGITDVEFPNTERVMLTISIPAALSRLNLLQKIYRLLDPLRPHFQYGFSSGSGYITSFKPLVSDVNVYRTMRNLCFKSSRLTGKCSTIRSHFCSTSFNKGETNPPYTARCPRRYTSRGVHWRSPTKNTSKQTK